MLLPALILYHYHDDDDDNNDSNGDDDYNDDCDNDDSDGDNDDGDDFQAQANYHFCMAPIAMEFQFMKSQFRFVHFWDVLLFLNERKRLDH